MKRSLTAILAILALGPAMLGATDVTPTDPKIGHAFIDRLAGIFHEMATTGSGGFAALDQGLRQMMRDAGQARKENKINPVFYARYTKLLRVCWMVLQHDPEGLLVPVLDREVGDFVRDVTGEEWSSANETKKIGFLADTIAEEIVNLLLYLDTQDARVKMRKDFEAKFSGPEKKAANPPGQAPPSAKAEYRGRLLTGSGPTTPGVVNVRILVDRLSSPEELAELAKLAEARDFNRLFDKAAAIKTGSIQYLGGSGLRIDLNMAFAKRTDKGKTIYLVAESQPADPTASWPKAGTEAAGFKRVYDAGDYLVVALELGEDNKGEGKIYQKAKVKFTPDGGFELLGYATPPLVVANLRLQ